MTFIEKKKRSKILERNGGRNWSRILMKLLWNLWKMEFMKWHVPSTLQ